MNCPTCGKDNPENAQFCGGCGASLSASTPIGIGAASSEPPTGSFTKTIKTTHHRRIKPWMWIVFVVGLLWFAFGYFYTLDSYEDWGQVGRGDSFAEEGQSSGLPESGPATPIFLDDFTKITEVAPLVLEGEISGDATYQSWSFEGNKGQILQFELRPKPESHIDFGHVRKTLFTGQGDSREGKEDAHFEVIARDEQLEEIELPYTGTYTLSFEGNPENSSGAYTITISRRQPQ